MRRGRIDKAELLRRLPVFGGAARRELERLGASADELQVPPGEVLFREGTLGRELVMLLEGEVEISREGRVVNRVGPGEVVGEIALVTRGRRTATVRTTAPTRLLVVTDHAYRSFASRRTQEALAAVALARAV